MSKLFHDDAGPRAPEATRSPQGGRGGVDRGAWWGSRKGRRLEGARDHRRRTLLTAWAWHTGEKYLQSGVGKALVGG